MKTICTYTMALMLGAALVFPVAAANAEGYGKISASQFSKMDTDKSGTLSESEFKAAGKTNASFDALDTNNDNSLTLAELQPAAGNKSATEGTSARSMD